MKPLKYLVSMTGGGTPNTETPEFWGGDIPWVSPKDMKSEVINSSEDTVTQLGVSKSSTSLIKKGSLLIVFRSGILQRTIPVGVNEIEVTLNQDMKSLTSRSEHFDINFLRWFIKGNEVNLLLEWSKKGVTVESLETEYLNTFKIPLPPIEEQLIICSSMVHSCEKIENLLIKEAQRIELLGKYRQSLISSVVTGKVAITEDMI
jgi:type I restriction enzyme S subunit